MVEVDITLEELAQILGEELQLPNIEPRGKKNIVAEEGQATPAFAASGPTRCATSSASYREALKRQISTRASTIPTTRSWCRSATICATAPGKTTLLPESNAVIIYMMDVSGSMGTEQKELVRITAFWIETWLRSQYK